MSKASRTVTRKSCVVCEGKFRAKRRDARYCSGRCRQRANRARAERPDAEERVEDLRRAYWRAVQDAAEARGVPVSRILTEESQFVDEEGNVYIKGEHVGTTTPHRPGWSAWGLEAAGPPFSPPPQGR